MEQRKQLNGRKRSACEMVAVVLARRFSASEYSHTYKSGERSPQILWKAGRSAVSSCVQIKLPICTESEQINYNAINSAVKLQAFEPFGMPEMFGPENSFAIRMRSN